MTSQRKLEKIAEAHNLDIGSVTEGGRSILQLEGRAGDIRKVVEQIEGWNDYWVSHEFKDPADDEPARVNLYSGKVRWDKLGY